MPEIQTKRKIPMRRCCGCGDVDAAVLAKFRFAADPGEPDMLSSADSLNWLSDGWVGVAGQNNEGRPSLLQSLAQLFASYDHFLVIKFCKHPSGPHFSRFI